jgi:AcrR family transcriptional regulator
MARKPADQTVNRDEIIAAAADVLRNNGYEATTMKDIAAAVNLTAASLYHHFKNKDYLLLAVLEAGLEYIITQVDSITESALSPADKLRRMIEVHVVGVCDNTAVGAAMVFEIRTLMRVNGSVDEAALRERRDLFFARRDHFENLFRQVIRQGIERGDFRDVDVPVLTRTMLGAQNWVGVWYRPGGRLDGAQIAQTMADTFLRSLNP